MALGARADGVVRLIVREGMTVAVASILLGLVAAAALGRTLATLLYGIAPRDPRTLAGVAAILACVALVACLLPARRAARVDPIVALRDE